MKKLSIVALILAIVAVVVSGIAITKPQVVDEFGSKTADFINAVKGFKVNGTEVISSSLAGTFVGITNSSSMTVGSGTAITKIVCVSTTTDWAAFSASSHCQWGTTTMTGLTTSTDGGWNMSISPVATTSGLSTGNVNISLIAYPTSTNVVEIRVCNSSSTDTTNLPAQRYGICGIKY